MKAILPYILAVVLFFAGRWTKTNDTSEFENKVALERKYHADQISKKDAKIIDLTMAGEMIVKKMKADSLEAANALQANNRAFLKLKKEHEKINLSRASAAELDSIRARLLALHSPGGK
jgi:hypothetical protein